MPSNPLTGYPCPACACRTTEVIDSRAKADDARWRRRRKCAACGYRWTTYEINEEDLARRDADAAVLHKILEMLNATDQTG